MTRRRITHCALVALALTATIGLAGGDAAAGAKGKKKRSGNKALIFTNATPQAIPDRPAGVDQPLGVLTSAINVGKKLKGKEIADVDVSVAAQHPFVEDLNFTVTAPNGATTFLAGGNPGPPGSPPMAYGTGSGCSGTPTTFSDETENFISNSSAAVIPGQVLAPWAATVQPQGFPLKILDGGPAKGTWTLRVFDSFAGDTGTLTCWRLRITPRNRQPGGS